MSDHACIHPLIAFPGGELWRCPECGQLWQLSVAQQRWIRVSDRDAATLKRLGLHVP